MKKLKYFILSVIFCFVACTKNNYDKYNFELSEITQRDSKGKLIGNEQINDWVLINYNDIDEFGKRAIENSYTLTHPNESLTDFSTKNYKKDCTELKGSKLVVYPNPLINGYCDINVSYFFAYKVAKSIVVKTDKYEEGNTSESSLNLLSPNFPALLKRDYYLHYLIYTTDSCLYYTRGKIIGCK